MTELLQFALYAALVIVGAWGIGRWMALVFDRSSGRFGVMTQIEGGFCRLCGVDPNAQQGWVGYAGAALAFNAAGVLLLYALLLAQGALPLNPAELPGLDPALAFNTAISFATNTNWQAYGGETTLSHLSQMAGLGVQNFVSAATGVAVAVAVIRGFTRAETPGVGNFWVDLVRAVLWLFLPAAVVVGLVLVALGVPQTFAAAVEATTLEGAAQTIAVGPAASQIAIKQLGTNGGGVFNVNSAHPLENPGALSNLIQLWAILAIPAAFCVFFGRMARDARQGRAIFWAMTLLFLAGFAAIWAAESAGNPLVADAVAAGAGNMEGKEARFGVMLSSLWAAATTAASNGSVNAMHDSFTPLGGGVALLNILLGEIVFGGVGAGFYGMLLFVVLTVFLAGLMVGRTPEYLGKKIEAHEIKLAVLAFLVTPVGVLLLGGLAAVAPPALVAVQDPGPHGLTEILYAYASAIGNNGSAFAGFGAAEPWHLVAQGFAMLLGRYGIIIPMLAIAGSLAAKRAAPESAGTFPTHGPLFIGLLMGTILVLGGLTFFPALALGPIAEHMAIAAGQGFGG